MTQSRSNLLPISLILLAGAIILAALILVFSPMLWTDHAYRTDKPVPTGCSLQPAALVVVVHCPSWVNY